MLAEAYGAAGDTPAMEQELAAMRELEERMTDSTVLDAAADIRSQFHLE